MDLMCSVMFHSAERNCCCCCLVKYSGRHSTMRFPSCPAAPFSSQQTVKNVARRPSSSAALCCSDQFVRNVIYYLNLQLTVQVALCSLDTESKFEEIRGTRASHSLWNPAIIQSYNMDDSHLSRSTGFSSFYLIVHKSVELYIWETNWTWLLARLPEID